MKREFSTFIAFLLFALMLFKVSSFHAYSHHDTPLDDIENCKVCELAVENSNTEYLFTNSQTLITPFTPPSTYHQPATYEMVVSSSFLCFNFFGRPPPNVG
jgi:hypothetical protein